MLISKYCERRSKGAQKSKHKIIGSLAIGLANVREKVKEGVGEQTNQLKRIQDLEGWISREIKALDGKVKGMDERTSALQTTVDTSQAKTN